MNHKSKITSRKSQVKRRRSNSVWSPRLLVAFSLLLALLAASPLWGLGIVNTRGGGDSPFLLQRTMDMAETLRHGIFPPRWMSHAAYDLGYPMFNHYAALPYYLSGGLTALGFSPLVAIQATQTLGFMLAALTMALWASHIYPSKTAILLSVAAYTFAPFHLVNVYVRGDSLSEFYAFVWYPLILWTLARLAARPTRRRTLAAALAYGALILTHNVSAMIFSPFALLYALIKIVNGRRSAAAELSAAAEPTSPIPNLKSKIKNLTLPFLLAFLLTAWFWIPAIFETHYGQMGAEFTADYFHYSQHFRALNLVQPSFLFNYAIAIRTADAGPFAMGLIQALLTVAGVIALVASHKSQVASHKSQVASHKSQIASHKSQVASRKSQVASHKSQVASHKSNIKPSPFSLPPAPFLLFGLALSTFMLTPLSKSLWASLPLLELTQFPWRFLSIQALFTAIITGALGQITLHTTNHADETSAKPRTSHLPPPASCLLPPASCLLPPASCLLPPASCLLPPASCLLPPASCLLPLTLIILSSLLSLHPERLRIDTDAVTWETLLFYETFTGNIGTTIRYEYLPQAVNPRLYISESVIDGQGRPIPDGAVALDAMLQKRTPTRQTWTVTLDQAAPVAFPLNWWPGWTARLDGAPLNTRPMPGSGRLTVDVPAGTHTLTLRLRNTPLQTWAAIISGVTSIGCILWLSREAQRNRHPHAVRYALFATSLLALALVPPFITQRPASPPTFFDFHAIPYPHAGPVDFGSAQLESAALYPGDTLTITHTWTFALSTPLTGTLRLVSPAEPRHGIPLAFAETEITLYPGPRQQRHATPLTLAPDLARGLYLLEIRLHGQTRPATYIGAVRVPHGPALSGHEPVLATFRDLTLHTITARQPDATSLRVKSGWSTTGTPRNWSLSLRLLDADGRQIVQQDPETHGYGYLPTTLWLPGELVTDYAVLPLPDGLAPGDYTLRIITYLRATDEGGGAVDIPIRITTPTRYVQKHASAPILCENDSVALLDVALPATLIDSPNEALIDSPNEALIEGQDLDTHAEWQARAAPRHDLTATWALHTLAGNIVASTSGPLAAGSRTSEWPRHTWVRAPLHLDLPATLDAGDYTLHLTLSGDGLTDATCALPTRLSIIPRPRAFDAPHIPHPQPATFGDTVRLLGYDLGRDDTTLILTLWWQAQTTPTRDYKRFVHLYAPATEAIVAQNDAMPRAWTYPTTLWIENEVVSESVTLDLSPIAPGDYRIAVGWYDPETVTRLPAHDAKEIALPLERVVLDTHIKP